MELKVEGMTCGGCVSSVRRILTKQLDVGEDQVIVDLDASRATVPDDVPGERLDLALQKLSGAGFPAARI
mgnify:CR=1 FL=1